jgi:hypothetical protein
VERSWKCGSWTSRSLHHERVALLVERGGEDQSGTCHCTRVYEKAYVESQQGEDWCETTTDA